MGRSSALLVVCLVALSAATDARSALLYWQGSLDVDLGVTSPPYLVTGTGVATVNGSSGFGHLSTLRLAGGIGPVSEIYLVTDPNLPEIDTVIGNVDLQTGTLAPISGGGPLTQNAMPLAGSYKICFLLIACSAFLEYPLTQNGTRGLGIGGLITANGFGAGLRISVFGAPWTVATAKITGLWTTNDMIPNASRATGTVTLVGFAHGPVSATSTATTNGVLQLVSAGRIETTLNPTDDVMAAPAVLKLVFVPEPGLLLLLASGVGGLTLLGRRRLRR
jgi:hypothetical protein